VVEAYGVDRLLRELRQMLLAGTYHAPPVRRVLIPKPDGRQRPLGIPTVRDRVVQQAAKLVLEPIFEADFHPCSFGFRPKRSATQALETIRKAYPAGHHFVVEADIVSFFDRIDHDRLMHLIERRVSDKRVLKLLRGWLKAGVMDEGRRVELVSGTPQGGVISPLLANVYLNAFDHAWAEHGTGQLVRYADDLVILCKTRAQAEHALVVLGRLMADLGLELHPDKTKVVDLREGREGFDFLGCHLRARMSGPIWEKYGKRRYYLQRWPSKQSMKRIRAKIKARTGRSRVGAQLPDVIAELNPILRGWGSYFRTGNAGDCFTTIDRYAHWRVKRLLIKQRGRNLRAGQADKWHPDWLHEQGLHRLRGTIRYPRAA
jgi:RNA-directed DNA polymerase